MKKRFLLATMAACLLSAGTSLFAQEDMTPSRYIFANQPLGKYKIDFAEAGTAWNPTNSLPQARPASTENPTGMYDGGFIESFGPGGAGSSFLENLKNAMSVIDMGGQVGKVLCIRGDECTDDIFAHGLKATGNINGWHLAFFADANPAKFATGSYVRCSVTFKVFQDPELLSDVEQFVTWHYKNYQNNMSSENYTSNGVFSDGSKGTFMPNEWRRTEFDAPANDYASCIPMFMKFYNSASSGFAKSAFLIKEIKFTIMNDAAKYQKGVKNELVELTWGDNFDPYTPTATAISNTAADNVKFDVQGGKLTVYGAAAGETIEVFNTLGAKVASQVSQSATETINLSKGLFIVKVAGKSFKVVLN